MPEPSPTRGRRGRLHRAGAAFLALLTVAGYVVVQYVAGDTGAPGCKVVSGDDERAVYEFTPEQAVNAATITAVGTARDLPERAVAIALATALQESALRNLGHGDRDSLGLFQQRPSQGWGTPQEIMDPAHAAGLFYDHLVKVPDYTRLPLTVAAQRVQRSGFPEAYAKHEPDAVLLAAALTGRAAATLTCVGNPGAHRAEGPDVVRAALVRDFGQSVLRPAGARADAAAPASPAPTPSTGTTGTTDRTGTRTVTLPVGTAGGDGAQGDPARRGWQLAHWAVANASALHIERVSYAGRQWTAGNTDSKWWPTGADGQDGQDGQDVEDGKGGAKGGDPATGPVRITSAR